MQDVNEAKEMLPKQESITTEEAKNYKKKIQDMYEVLRKQMGYEEGQKLIVNLIKFLQTVKTQDELNKCIAYHAIVSSSPHPMDSNDVEYGNWDGYFFDFKGDISIESYLKKLVG